MRRRIVIPITALVFVLVGAPALLAADSAAGTAEVVGTWNVELTYEGELQKITMKIETRDDGSLTGTWIGPHRTNELVDFAWDGTRLTFTRNVNRQGTPVALRYEATVDGDSMKGEITQPEGVVPFTAKRQPAK